MTGMDRRAFLGGIAATIATASGCQSRRDDFPRTPAATETQTERTSTATPTEQPPSTSEPTATAPEPTTPGPHNRDLSEARRLVGESLSAYVDETAGSGGISEPVAAQKLTEDHVGLIRDDLHDARSILRDLDDADLTDAQAARRDGLMAAHWLAWWAPSVHHHLSIGHQRLYEAWDAIEGPWEPPGDKYEAARESATAAADELESLREDLDSDALEGTSLVGVGPAGIRLIRFQNELDQIDSMVQELTTVQRIGSAYQASVSDYFDGEHGYQLEATKFYEVRDQSESWLEDLNRDDWTESVTGTLDSMACYVEGWRDRAEVLEEAADAGAAGNHQKRRVIEGDDPGDPDCGEE